MSKKVILISIDGLRADAFVALHKELGYDWLAKSTYCLHEQTVMPSVTLPCHTSMFHSVPPARHGTTTNVYMPQVRPVNGLFDVLSVAGKTNAMFYAWQELRDLYRPNHVVYSYFLSMYQYQNTDQTLTAEALQKIESETFDFTFLYLGVTDSFGHRNGWMSPEYMQTAKEALICANQVIEKFAKDHVIIVTSDHGGHERTHGYDIPEDMTIPLIITGDGIAQGKELPEASILDIAPTVVKLMDVAPDREWEGRALL